MEWLKKIALASVAVLAPIHTVLISVGFLIFADLITGVWAAIKRKEEISSAILRRTISKIVIYELAIIGGFVVERFLIGGSIPVSKIVSGVIGMVELKSMLENCNYIVGQDVFAVILKKLGSENDPKHKKPPQE